METSISIHVGTDARISAPDRADAYVEIEGRGATLSLFLGADDHDRIEVIDRLAEALLEVRVRCMQRLVTIDAGPAVDEAQVYGGDDRARQVADISESEQRALHGDR